MGCFEIDWRSPAVIKGGFPARDADTPTVAGFQTWKTPFGHRSYEIVPIEHGKIEKFLSDLNTNCMEPEVFGAGAAISVAIKSGQRIAATTAQFGAKHVGRHAAIIAQ